MTNILWLDITLWFGLGFSLWFGLMRFVHRQYLIRFKSITPKEFNKFLKANLWDYAVPLGVIITLGGPCSIPGVLISGLIVRS